MERQTKVSFVALLFIICFFISVAIADVVTLTALWDPPSTYSDVTRYDMWMSTTPTGMFVIEEEFTGGSTSQGYIAIDMTPGQTLYFQLTAHYIDGRDSGPSNTASYTYPLVTPPPVDPPPPVREAPRNLVLRPAS